MLTVAAMVAAVVSLPMDYHISLIRPMHLSDCSAFDHGNHWIFDAAIHLAKTSGKGEFPQLHGSFHQKVPG